MSDADPRGSSLSMGTALSRQIAASALLAILALAPLSAGRAQEDQIGLAVGTRPEAVEIEDLDGNAVDLGDYIGKRPLLVEFWATWCPLCEALMPKIEAAHARYGTEVEFLVVAVAVNQSPRRVRRELERHPVPGRVLWDKGGRAVRAFAAPSTSYVVVLDAAGRVVYTGLGEDQEIEAAVARALGR